MCNINGQQQQKIFIIFALYKIILHKYHCKLTEEKKIKILLINIIIIIILFFFFFN